SFKVFVPWYESFYFGFCFLSTALKCELCNVFACGQCREPKGYTTKEVNKHTCDPNIVETVKLLKKDTKNCPECGKNIFRISGCAQMFCTPMSGGCGATFNWNTLQLEKGIVHNPHYFEWRNTQRSNQNIQNGACRDLHNHWSSYEMRNLVQNLENIHFFYYVRQNDNTFYREQYLENKIDKQKLSTIIQRRYKSYQKQQQIHNIINTLYEAAKDILFNYTHNEWRDSTTQDKIYDELTQLIDYLNNNLRIVCKSYNSSTPQIYFTKPQINDLSCFPRFQNGWGISINTNKPSIQ
ncbi:putative NTPase/helicase, partial [Mimivirus AB-566-O17]